MGVGVCLDLVGTTNKSKDNVLRNIIKIKEFEYVKQFIKLYKKKRILQLPINNRERYLIISLIRKRLGIFKTMFSCLHMPLYFVNCIIRVRSVL